MTDEPKVKPGGKGCKGCNRILYVTDPDYCPDCQDREREAAERIVGVVGPVVDALETLLGHCSLPEDDAE